MDLDEIVLQFKNKYSYIGANTIYVGMSGGVDSSVTAVLLKLAGFNVRGFYMLCWNEDTSNCTTDIDLRDAENVALTYDIPLQVLDLRKEYIQNVVQKARSLYEKGDTPNPDIACNDLIKFGALYDKIKEGVKGDFYLATGHYAIIRHNFGIGPASVLCSGLDSMKDQSYFLYRIINKHDRLGQIIFPLGEYYKIIIRDIAKKLNLKVASKPDSQGICFLGNVSLDTFLEKKPQKNTGNVINQFDEVIGKHKGCEYYTIGQRKNVGLSSYSGIPLYVIDKNIKTNVLVVGSKSMAFASQFQVKNLILSEIGFKPFKNKIQVRVRNLGKKIPCKVLSLKDKNGKIRKNLINVKLDFAEFGIAPGQHAVFYKNDHVIGGGIIGKVNTTYKQHFTF